MLGHQGYCQGMRFNGNVPIDSRADGSPSMHAMVCGRAIGGDQHLAEQLEWVMYALLLAPHGCRSYHHEHRHKSKHACRKTQHRLQLGHPQ